jgi:hypothetical protein
MVVNRGRGRDSTRDALFFTPLIVEPEDTQDF